jgi:hypothetical protein
MQLAFLTGLSVRKDCVGKELRAWQINDPTLKDGVCVMPHALFSEFRNRQIYVAQICLVCALKFCFKLTLRFIDIVLDYVSSYISDRSKEFATLP